MITTYSVQCGKCHRSSPWFGFRFLTFWWGVWHVHKNPTCANPKWIRKGIAATWRKWMRATTRQQECDHEICKAADVTCGRPPRKRSSEREEHDRMREVVEAAREMFHAAHRFDCPNCGRSIVSECGCSFGVLVARVETALALLEGKEPDRGA